MQDDQKRNDAQAKNDALTSRRAFLQRFLFLGAAGTGAGVMLSSCGGGGSEATCDTSGLTEEELATRERFGYVAQSPKPEQHCSNCQFWQPDAVEGTCGGCQLFAGPVHPEGWCNSWVQGSS